MEELVARSPDSVNLRNAAGHLPSEVAGCEAARDLVKPGFKKAVNAVQAALKLSALENLHVPTPEKTPLSSKLSRTALTSNSSSPVDSVDARLERLHLEKMKLGAIGSGTVASEGGGGGDGDTTPTMKSLNSPVSADGV